MMRKILVIAAIAAALVLVPQVTQAQFKAGDWTLSLGGNATNGPDFNGTTISFNGELAYFVTPNLALGVRQGVNYTDLTGAGGSLWSGYTAVAADWHFDMGKWQPYIGANIGYIYGDVNDSWIAGPEAGVKYFVNQSTFIQLQIQYQFFIQESISDGQFVYGLSIGFKL